MPYPNFANIEVDEFVPVRKLFQLLDKEHSGRVPLWVYLNDRGVFLGVQTLPTGTKAVFAYGRELVDLIGHYLNRGMAIFAGKIGGKAHCDWAACDIRHFAHERGVHAVDVIAICRYAAEPAPLECRVDDYFAAS